MILINPDCFPFKAFLKKNNQYLLIKFPAVLPDDLFKFSNFPNQIFTDQGIHSQDDTKYHRAHFSVYPC